MAETIPRRKLYQEVLDRLMDRIRSGEIEPGAQLPSERELMEQYETALAIDEMGLQDDAPPARDEPLIPAYVVNDPTTLTFQVEAWMPESIAVMKLRGYAHDMGGEVIESVPGLVRLRLGANSGRSTQSFSDSFSKDSSGLLSCSPFFASPSSPASRSALACPSSDCRSAAAVSGSAPGSSAPLPAGATATPGLLALLSSSR